MPCYYPMSVWYGPGRTANGKRIIVFKASDAARGEESFRIPCGQCVGCRLEYSRQWAVRCVHEASLHDSNSFITLTYSDDFLPSNYSLQPDDVTLFWKRLRHHLSPLRIRYFYCGEYGDETQRPHYHALVFGYDFPDKELYKVTARGDRLYVSPMLEEIWGKGFCPIGELTFESAAYTARYVMKKVTGKGQDEIDPETGLKPYELYDPTTGEVFKRVPEFCRGSRNPGIAAKWINKFHKDVYPWDETIMRGVPQKPPKFYDRKYDEINPEGLEVVKAARKESLAKVDLDEQTDQRLDAKHVVKLAQTNQLKRNG